MKTITLDTILWFGKYKGELVSDLLPGDITSDVEAKQFMPFLKYFAWIKRETQYVLSSEVIERVKLIFSQQPKKFDEPYKYKSSKGSRLGHYNDMGAMNDISFQDCYGDFGF